MSRDMATGRLMNLNNALQSNSGGVEMANGILTTYCLICRSRADLVPYKHKPGFDPLLLKFKCRNKACKTVFFCRSNKKKEPRDKL